MKLWSEFAILVLAASLCGVASAFLHPDPPALYVEDEPLKEGEVSLEMVRERWGMDGVVWIDARLREKFEQGHVAGAVLLNEQEWDTLLFEGTAEVIFDAAEKPMVVYCGSHSCQASHKVAEKMRDEMGVPEVYVLRGGWRVLEAGGLADPAGG